MGARDGTEGGRGGRGRGRRGGRRGGDRFQPWKAFTSASGGGGESGGGSDGKDSNSGCSRVVPTVNGGGGPVMQSSGGIPMTPMGGSVGVDSSGAMDRSPGARLASGRSRHFCRSRNVTGKDSCGFSSVHNYNHAAGSSVKPSIKLTKKQAHRS